MCTQHTYRVMNAQNDVEQPVYPARALSKLNTVSAYKRVSLSITGNIYLRLEVKSCYIRV